MKHRAASAGEQAELARRLDALAQRHGVSGPGREQLQVLLELVSADQLAPTAVRAPARALDDHLADSLVALELPELHAAGRVADLGAGAGFPGLPLAIALRETQFALVESSGRKCEFIQRAVEACRIPNATVVNARAEAWPDGIGVYDLVLARALAPLAVVAEYAAPLLREGGALVVWRGRRDAEEEAAGAQAARLLGLDPRPPQRVQPYRGALNRHLQLMVKLSPTPARFPRRPGVAHKRPLASPASDRPQR